MTRIARDSVTASDIPTEGCQLFGGYVNGRVSQWKESDWERFPKGTTYTIDVLGTMFDADELDVEVGDPTDTVGFPVTVNWVKKHEGNFLPILYANRATLTPMFNALNKAGLYVGKHFLLHIATLDGKTKTVEDMTGVVAVQWKGAAQTGGHYDESIVYDDAWKRVEPIKPPAPPVVTMETGLLITNGKTTDVPSSRLVTSRDGGKTWQ